MAGKKVGVSPSLNHKMRNYVAWYQRHHTPQEFATLVAGDVRIQAFLQRQASLTAAEKAIEEWFIKIGSKCMTPALKAAGKVIADKEKASAPSASGTLKQSIGIGEAKLYPSNFCGYIATGPRRGYGRVVTVVPTKKGTKLKRQSKKASLLVAPIERKNPVFYAYFLTHGRKAIQPRGKKALLIGAAGFSGLRAKAKAQPAQDFMAPATRRSKRPGKHSPKNTIRASRRSVTNPERRKEYGGKEDRGGASLHPSSFILHPSSHMANITWNGSVASAGANITPLTELHAPNDPPEFDTTGSTDTTHLHGTGKHKCQATMGFLGSQFPPAGTVVSMSFTIGNSDASYANTAMPGAPALAFPTQVSISGRKDGRIEGNATLVPADTSISATTWTVTQGDLGFNGHAFSFAGTDFTGIVGAQYSGTCQAIDSTGAEASTPVATVNVPGIIDESVTITTLGPPQCAAKATGATVNTWNDGGKAGTSTGTYTAECVSTHPGGQLDGQTTTEHVFKMRRTGGGNS